MGFEDGKAPQDSSDGFGEWGDRPVGFLEAYYSGRSRDYEFGILQLDLKSNSKGKEEGSGALLYAAKIKVIGGSSIELETYGISPIRLMGVRKL